MFKLKFVLKILPYYTVGKEPEPEPPEPPDPEPHQNFYPEPEPEPHKNDAAPQPCYQVQNYRVKPEFWVQHLTVLNISAVLI
jgi:hypothetical protein